MKKYLPDNYLEEIYDEIYDIFDFAEDELVTNIFYDTEREQLVVVYVNEADPFEEYEYEPDMTDLDSPEKKELMSYFGVSSIKSILKIKCEKGCYIGDPCYALSKERYEQWGKELNWDDGIINDEWCAIGTYSGDGVYYDEDGHRYSVDSGAIGLMPVEIAEKTSIEKLNRLGFICKESGTYEIKRTEDGTFTIKTPTGKKIVIETGYDA